MFQHRFDVVTMLHVFELNVKNPAFAQQKNISNAKRFLWRTREQDDCDMLLISYLLCELTICGIKPYMKVKIQYFKIPPITVFISDACPGQSTNVYCTTPCPVCVRWLGTSTWTEEKPKSSVMPRSRLCGFLSKLAVLAVVLRTFDKLVLPLSTWPKTPTLKLNMEAAILVRFVVSRDVTCLTLYRI